MAGRTAKKKTTSRKPRGGSSHLVAVSRDGRTIKVAPAVVNDYLERGWKRDDLPDAS